MHFLPQFRDIFHQVRFRTQERLWSDVFPLVRYYINDSWRF